MRGLVGQLFVAGLLTLGLGAQLVEVSGRWDHTIQDTNDEVGIVAVVLCCGVALTAAGSLLARLRFLRNACRIVLAALLDDGVRLGPAPFSNGPSPGLRI